MKLMHSRNILAEWRRRPRSAGRCKPPGFRMKNTRFQSMRFGAIMEYYRRLTFRLLGINATSPDWTTKTSFVINGNHHGRSQVKPRTEVGWPIKFLSLALLNFRVRDRVVWIPMEQSYFSTNWRKLSTTSGRWRWMLGMEENQRVGEYPEPRWNGLGRFVSSKRLVRVHAIPMARYWKVLVHPVCLIWADWFFRKTLQKTLADGSIMHWHFLCLDCVSSMSRSPQIVQTVSILQLIQKNTTLFRADGHLRRVRELHLNSQSVFPATGKSWRSQRSRSLMTPISHWSWNPSSTRLWNTARTWLTAERDLGLR